MKRNIIYFFAIGIFLTLGCEKLKVGNNFLAKAPGVDITEDTIFHRLDYAERFLWGAYATLPFGLPTSGYIMDELGKENLDDLTDISHSVMGWGGATQWYYPGQYDAAHENGQGAVNDLLSKYNWLKDRAFSGIRKAKIFLENIDRVPNVDPDYVKQLKAEARMIIAIHYSEMYRNMGGSPWVSKAYDVTDNLTHLPRMKARATCDSIVALCDKAIPDLPWAITNLTEWDGRFTKAAAMGLKARILLFDASPLFNSATPYLDGEASQEHLTWHGGYDANLWKRAADAAHDLITQVEAGSDYKIYRKAGNSFRQDFQDAYFQRGNGEVLISTRSGFRTPNPATESFVAFVAYYSWGAGMPTHEYVEMFPDKNGLPITNPASLYNPADPYKNRDPRLYETILTNGDAYQGRTAELWIGGRERLTQGGTQARSGYIMRKFLLDNNSATSWGAIFHWPFLRLPEIYLSYAEADNEFNGGPSAEDYRCVNIVRNRVGLGNLPASLTKEQFREAVLLERTLEFGYEKVHFFDLARWKKADAFQKPLHRCNIVRSASPPYTYTYTYQEMEPRYWWTTWSPKWYLSALPLNEILKNYGLVQNPGWE